MAELPKWDVLMNHEFRDLVCSWLRANGIDPGDVPAESPIHLVGGQLIVTVWTRDAGGGLSLDPSTGRPWSREQVAPLKVAPPDDVIEWLRQRGSAIDGKP